MTRAVEVLVLDDEPTVGKRLATALAKLGCTVETFIDPAEAMRRMEEKEFDIVITDVVMPQATGVQVLEHAARTSPRTKVILITGYAMMSLAREAMKKGAFDFVAKPFRVEEIREIVTRAAEALGLAVSLAESAELANG